MPQEITAVRTAKIISFVRRKINDRGYKKFESDGELFTIADDVVENIAKEDFLIKEDVLFDLSPDRYHYSEMDIVDAVSNILRYDKVYLLFKDNTESKPLTLVSQREFEDERKRGLSDPMLIRFPNLLTQYDAQRPRCYYIDDDYSFYYYKPVTEIGTRMVIKCSRLPLEGELINEENNPKLPTKYDKYIRYGMLQEICASSSDPVFIKQTSYWMRMFEGYKKEGMLKTKEMPQKAYKEF